MQFQDQMGEIIELNKTPLRVVSLVPSQTELLYYLGVPPIAQTLFCIHPKAEFKQSTKVGGTKKLNLDKIKALKPDLIIGNKEENEKDQIETLRESFPVWMSDINSYDNAIAMITELSSVVGKGEQGRALVDAISSGFEQLASNANKPKVLYLIWRDPFMAVGSNSFIHSMLEQAGFENVCAEMDRYPLLSLEEIRTLDPEFIFLSSEPFPFKEEHKEDLKELAERCRLVDGELFSWYGSWMLKAPQYFQELRSKL